MKKTLLLLLVVFTLFSVCSLGTSEAFAEKAITTDGVYLLGTTSMDGGRSRLFFSQNFYSSGDVTRSCVRIFDYSDGNLTDSGISVRFSGEIKRVRYGLNRLFVHIGDTLYTVDLRDSTYNARIIACQSELIMFEADDSNVYCVFKSSADECKLSTTPINAFDDQAYTIPYWGNLLPFSSVTDIYSDGQDLYLLNGEDRILKRNLVNGSDIIYKDMLCGDSIPQKIFTFNDRVVFSSGNSYIYINDLGEASEVCNIDGMSSSETVLDAVTFESNTFILNGSDCCDYKEIKEYSFESGKAVFDRVAMKGNSIYAEIPDFSEDTFGNAVLSGKYEIVYALSYPSNVVYSYAGEDEKYGDGVFLKGRLISPNEPILILNYDTDGDFYLVLYKGKLGYIVKHDSTLATVHDKLKEINPDSSRRHRKNANQTLSVFALPSSENANAFLVEDYKIPLDDTMQVKVCYELDGLDSEGVKWVYASYIDQSGVIRYGFIFSGDLIDASDNEITYTLMKANPKFGQKLRIYESNTPLSKEVASLASGTIVNVYDEIEEQDKSVMMCYVKVRDDNGVVYGGYVYKSGLIDKNELSIHQQFGIATIITAVFIGLVVVVAVIYHRKTKKNVADDIVAGESLSDKPSDKRSKKRKGKSTSYDMEWF